MNKNNKELYVLQSTTITPDLVCFESISTIRYKEELKKSPVFKDYKLPRLNSTTNKVHEVNGYRVITTITRVE